MGETTARTPDVTRLLAAWSAGRQDALDQLMPAVYGELRRMARGQLAGARRRHTFQPTDLVHEAFVRLVDQRAPWQSRVHFFGIAATCMRRVLGDYARRRKAIKRPQIDQGRRGGPGRADCRPGHRSIACSPSTRRSTGLSRTDARQGRVAELKLFANLEIEEIATLLGVSAATVKRDWQGAKPVLRDILAERPRDPR